MTRVLHGKTALVIGGSSGIGNAIAHGFQENGARVSIAARTQSKVEAAVARLQQQDAGAKGYVADVSHLHEIAHLADTVLSDFGHLDILVVSQGTTLLKPAEEFSPAEYDAIMDVNMRSVFFSCTHFGRHMLTCGEGAIITIASLAAHRGWSGSAVYAHRGREHS